MDFKYQAVNFDPDQQLKKLVEQKTQKFDKFKEHLVSGDLFLRHESQTNRGKKVEVKCVMKGKTLFAHSEAEEFEQAIDDAINKMLRQIRKRKEKLEP